MSPSIDANASLTEMGTETTGRARKGQGSRRFPPSFHPLIEDQNEEGSNWEHKVRLAERRRERTRIARELHDTLFQGFFGASMVLHNAVDALPEASTDKQRLGKALEVMRRVLEEGRTVLQGLRAPAFAPASIEQELSGLARDFAPAGLRCQISVTGTPRVVQPAVQEEINSIGREALVNALLHAKAARVEIEVEYSARRLRVVVRDDGRGIDPQVAQSREGAHWGLLSMRERAESIGAALAIWSRPGAGTEVEISVPSQILAEVCA